MIRTHLKCLQKVALNPKALSSTTTNKIYKTHQNSTQSNEYKQI